MVALSQHKFSVPQIVSVAVAAWTLQILLGKWIKAKRVAQGMRRVIEVFECVACGTNNLNPWRTVHVPQQAFLPFCIHFDPCRS